MDNSSYRQSFQNVLQSIVEIRQMKKMSERNLFLLYLKFQVHL